MTPPVIEPHPADRRTAHPPAARRPGPLRRQPRPTSAEFLQTALAGRGRRRRCWRGSGGSTCWSGWRRPYRTDYANLGRLRIDLPDGRGQVELSANWPTSATGVGPNARQPRERPPADRHPLQHPGPRPGQRRRRDPAARRRTRSTLPEGYFVEYGDTCSGLARLVLLPGPSAPADRTRPTAHASSPTSAGCAVGDGSPSALMQLPTPDGTWRSWPAAAERPAAGRHARSLLLGGERDEAHCGPRRSNTRLSSCVRPPSGIVQTVAMSRARLLAEYVGGPVGGIGAHAAVSVSCCASSKLPGTFSERAACHGRRGGSRMWSPRRLIASSRHR